MSKYEWERGEIVLPPPAARKMRARLFDLADKARTTRIGLVSDFYDFEKQVMRRGAHRSAETIARSIDAWENHRHQQAEQRRTRDRFGYSSPGELSQDDLAAMSDAAAVVQRRARAGQFGRPSNRDLNAAFPKPAKTGPLTVNAGWEATATIDGTTLRWSVPENNHAVETARDSTVGRAVFEELGKVEWKPRTGGEIRGNDEYNRESGEHYTGGGGSYSTGGYGPLGDPHFVTAAQHAALRKSAATFRAKPGNAGLCGMRTILNGKRTGPPCRNRSGSCPVHNPSSVRRAW